MQKGEHLYCECGAELEVLKPCTCEAKQETVTCVCGRPMRSSVTSGT